jgi:hypothetical protein
MNVLLKLIIIFTGYACTVLPTSFRRRKAFAIHLEAKSFFTSTSYFLFLRGIVGSLNVGALLGERVLLRVLLLVTLWDVNVLVDIEGKGVDGVYHFERVMDLGYIVHRWKQIKCRLNLLVHG